MKIIYKSIIISKNREGKITKIENKEGVTIDAALFDSVRYLKEFDVKEECVLYYHNSRLTISATSDVFSLLNSFYGKYNYLTDSIGI